jgi:hypothetical protein
MNELPLPEIRDISPPVPVFPYPPWMVAVAIVLGVILLGLIVWLVFRLVKRQQYGPPPAPREIALSQLEALRPEIVARDPRRFSDEVSGVLRTYLTKQYGLRAPQQTSQEFLESISGDNFFDSERQEVLSRFLEKCDLIKFARLEAGSSESEALLNQAFEFVRSDDSSNIATTGETLHPAERN